MITKESSISLRLKKDDLAKIKALADETGQSVSAFMVNAAVGRIGRRQKFTKGQTRWNCEVGSVLVKALAKERARPVRTEADVAYEMEIEAVLAVIGTE